MTVIVLHALPLDGRDPSTVGSRRLNALRAQLPIGRDGDTLYCHLDTKPVAVCEAERWVDDEVALANIGRLLNARYADTLAAIDARLDTVAA